ncbi:dephospho-CoA kinase [Ruegeria atlantica]|uniref:dephospho-CoA kinase n=1 Tax=Ruegeria atlantica TaxID=81569 RepID=UPI0014804FAD|nr:dephospho-CoA kinase [Ruegeria atlantica]
MSFALGLTGSIGMGKSTTAQLFVDEGCALWDADAAVHRLYSAGGAAVKPMHDMFPEAIIDGAVSRDALKQVISADPTALKVIESIVHPLVAADRAEFRENATADILVFDIPLLFETGGDAAMDAVVCVSIPADEQKRRVMERGSMTEAQFEQIRAKQMPNDEKCVRSDFVIVTDTLDHARAQVQDVVRQIRAGMADA